MSEPKNVPTLHVYSYQFLDYADFIKKPEDVFRDTPESSVAERVEQVRAAFLARGWEGDGEIGVIWLPPFVDSGVEDTWGTYLWHVKQRNDGVSWIASDQVLTFKRLERQNESGHWENHKLVSILYSDCTALTTRAAEIVTDLKKKLAAVNSLSDPIAKDIRDELLVVAQETLVSELMTFLDDCYLQVLLEVFVNGNRSGLKLRKVKATLDISGYQRPKDEFAESDEGDWFDVRGLVGDIVAAYKFEPYKEKMEMLTRALDFKQDDKIARELRKHVTLRNGIQHHEGQLRQDALKLIGEAKITLLADDGKNIELGPWSAITFSFRELVAFAKVLGEFAVALDLTAQTRVRTKYREPVEAPVPAPTV